MQLTRLAEDYEKIKQAGADLICISADAVPYAWSMAQTTGAKFQILSDSARKVIREYGVYNAAENGGIAHPAVFIVDKQGVVGYAYVGKDAGDRPEDAVIIEQVKKVAGAK